MTPATIEILLADDHRFFRDGIKGLLETVPDFKILGEASNGSEVVSKALALCPDIILMDVQMPEPNGIEATRQIVKGCSQTGIIILTMFDDVDSVISAMRAGARGYILKDAEEDEIIRSIRAVANGEALFGPAVAKRLMDYVTDLAPATSKQAFPELTDREREVLALIAEDRSNQVIAQHMGLSLKTVRNHVSNILAKLQVIDRREAMARAKAVGLSKPP